MISQNGNPNYESIKPPDNTGCMVVLLIFALATIGWLIFRIMKDF